jgi:hypothetical protein
MNILPPILISAITVIQHVLRAMQEPAVPVFHVRALQELFRLEAAFVLLGTTIIAQMLLVAHVK